MTDATSLKWCSRSCGNLLATFRKLSRYVHERPGDLGANAIVAYANTKVLASAAAVPMNTLNLMF